MPHIIVENDSFIAYLEEKPLVLGHCSVFLKRKEDSFMDLTDDELSKILVFSKPIAQAIKKVVSCEKIGIASIGLQLRQAHLHLVPIKSADDLNFTRAKLEISADELQKMKSLIQKNL